MKKLFRLVPLALGLSLGAMGLGCGSHSTLAPSVAEIKAGGVRVGIDQVEHDIIKLVVFNETDEPVRVYRDRVTLGTSKGERSRLPGGIGGLYSIPPHASHKLNVRFDLDDLPKGETVELHLNDAVMAGDNAVRFEAMPFVVE